MKQEKTRAAVVITRDYQHGEVLPRSHYYMGFFPSHLE